MFVKHKLVIINLNDYHKMKLLSE